MLKVAGKNPTSPNSIEIVISGDTPLEVVSPEAKTLALQESGLGGTRSLDPFSGGSYPVNGQGQEIQFGEPVGAGTKYHSKYVVNSR